jgi:selenocysteine lyase/cysteine desulfurase
MAAVRLRSRGVMVSARGAARVWGIRASVHFPNREEDVEALGEALRRLRAQGPRQALRYIVMV